MITKVASKFYESIYKPYSPRSGYYLGPIAQIVKLTMPHYYEWKGLPYLVDFRCLLPAAHQYGFAYFGPTFNPYIEWNYLGDEPFLPDDEVRVAVYWNDPYRIYVTPAGMLYSVKKFYFPAGTFVKGQYFLARFYVFRKINGPQRFAVNDNQWLAYRYS